MEEEGEEAEPEVEAVRGYYPPRNRPALGQEPGRIYVGNLPYTFTAAELTATFSEAGSVDDVQVLSREMQYLQFVPISGLPGTYSCQGLRIALLQIIYDKITDRSRGFAFVTMATAEEAAKAVQMFNGAVSSALVGSILLHSTQKRVLVLGHECICAL